MMLGKSIPEYIFIRTAIVALRLIAPLSVLWVAGALLMSALALPDPTWSLIYTYSLVYASLEAAFFLCVYLPRRYHLQKPANHPRLTREERRALFRKCAENLGSADYSSGWFFHSRDYRRENVVEWFLWAFFSTSMDADWKEWEDEVAEYVATAEQVLGRTFPEGYNKDTPCMRPTLDPVSMVHRPLLWYSIIGVIDFMTSLRLYSLGFCHYSDKRIFQSFPPRPLDLFSRDSNIDGLSYWYRPHRSPTKNPILFLHGIGIGLYPYTAFFADLTSRHPDIGIIVPEFLSISSRISSPPLSRPSTLTAIQHILDTHGLQRIILAGQSYGTALAAQLLRSPLAPRIPAALLVDPIPFLLYLPDVAYNFLYRQPRDANEWMLWYFASRDPDAARTLSRHFFWTENVLWKDELERQQVAVALAGRDQVVNAEAVRRYLTGRDGDEGEDGDESEDGDGGVAWRRGRMKVVWYPELDHAMIHTRARWGRLMRILDRFVRRPG